MNEFVAVAVIAVCMCVDERVERLRRVGFRPRHGVQHLLGEFEVEEGIDKERLFTIDNQASVTPAPTAVRLNPRVSAGSKVM